MDVQVSWVNVSPGDSLQDCETVKDVRAQVCDSHDCFWSDVILFDSDYNIILDTETAPQDVLCYFKPRGVYDAKRWQQCLTAHAIGGDKAGVERALRLMKEQSEEDPTVEPTALLTCVLTKCLSDAGACNILVDAGASMVNIISGEMTPASASPNVFRDVAKALNDVATAKAQTIAEGPVMELIDGIAAFIAADPEPSVVEATTAEKTTNKKKKKSGTVEEKEATSPMRGLTAASASSGKPDHIDFLLEHGILASVSALIQLENSSLREKAFSMISSIVQKASSQRKDMLVQEAQIFTHLTSALKQHVADADLFKLSIKLFSKSATRMRYAIDSGFTSEVLQWTASSNPDEVLIATDTYEAIITNANKQMLSEFYNADAVSRLLLLLSVEDVWQGRSDGHPFTSALKALTAFAKKLADEDKMSTSLPLRRIEETRIMSWVLEHPVASVVTAGKQLQNLFDRRRDEVTIPSVAKDAKDIPETTTPTTAPSDVQESPRANYTEPTINFHLEHEDHREPAASSTASAVTGPGAESEERENDFTQEQDDAREVASKSIRSKSSSREEEQADALEENLDDSPSKGAQLIKRSVTGNMKMQSRGQRKKRCKLDKNEEEPEEIKSSDDPKEIVILVFQYLALILNYVAKMLGTVCEYGAVGVCRISNSVGDACRKKKGARRR